MTKPKDKRIGPPLLTSEVPENAPVVLPGVNEGMELRAIRSYLQTGSLASVSRETGISIIELQKWTRTVWWQQELAALKRDANAASEAALTRILDCTLIELLDRVQLGDIRVDGQGKSHRTPIKADTLARIADVVFTKRQLIRNAPTAIAGDTNKLNTLAAKLRALGAKDITIIDGITEIDDAPQT